MLAFLKDISFTKEKEIFSFPSLFMMEKVSFTCVTDMFLLQVHEVLKLCNQLIPSTSKDVDNIQLVLAKEKILVNEPKFLHQFSADILPASIQVS